jgi:putative endonuclease
VREGYDSLPDTRSRGRAGERQAEIFLRGEGYRILERNVVTRAGEIDLVAEEGDVLCFVEVKTRRNAAHGPAVSFVPPAKRRRLARSAALYLAARGGPEQAVRFDVLGIELQAGDWRHSLIRDAFVYEGSFLV